MDNELYRTIYRYIKRHLNPKAHRIQQANESPTRIVIKPIGALVFYSVYVFVGRDGVTVAWNAPNVNDIPTHLAHTRNFIPFNDPQFFPKLLKFLPKHPQTKCQQNSKQ